VVIEPTPGQSAENGNILRAAGTFGEFDPSAFGRVETVHRIAKSPPLVAISATIHSVFSGLGTLAGDAVLIAPFSR
jgi:hypothetical protein